MERGEILEKLSCIIRDVLDDDDMAIDYYTEIKEIEGWDSLVNMTIIATVEDEFGIVFEMNDYLDIKTIEQFVNIIMRYV